MLEAFAAAHAALGDRHRRLAYERAAASVRAAGARIRPGVSRDELDALPHVGPSIAAKIREYLETGRVASLDALTAERFPRDFAMFVSIPGVGPKTALKLRDALGVETLDDLERAVVSGRILDVDGVSERLRARMQKEIPRVRLGGHERVPLPVAWPQAERLVDAVRRVPGVVAAEVAGSLRRRKDTVGDIDLVAAFGADDAALAARRAFEEHPDVAEVLQRGEHTRVALRGGLEADLWVVPASGWGAALSFATGSREHTLELRLRAQARGWSVKTHRVEDENGRALPAATEDEFYATLGLRTPAPEIRENRGELALAEHGGLPRLVEVTDLAGDLHVHTTASDGRADEEAMIAAAAARGLRYLALTDHAHGLPVPRGLDEDALLEMKARVQSAPRDVPVLVGAEVNILADGSLSLHASCLERLDVVVASVHSGLRDPRARITRRVIDALSTGLVDVLGHPTNRRLPARPASDLDVERVFEAAREHGTAVEVNGSPERMDLPGDLAAHAREMGLAFAIDSDAHAPGELANVRWGVAMARRGGLTRDHVLNALEYPALAGRLRGRRAGRTLPPAPRAPRPRS